MKGPMAKCLHENCPSVGRGRNILKLRINRCSTSSSARLITWMAVQVRPSDFSTMKFIKDFKDLKGFNKNSLSPILRRNSTTKTYHL